MRRELIKNWRAVRRMRRVRKKINGTPERPRLAVSRSNRHIGAQIIDDMAGRTLCAVNTDSPGVREQVGYGGNVKAAAVVGTLLGDKARQLGIGQVCLDRRGRKYHGRIKALADAAREAGLKF
ncbi:MAG: 50S ribosomal protein L18 [Phycisphaerae bacterium]|nr:50S ribosomal protein L18 [Phycisphaerae bacterium]